MARKKNGQTAADTIVTLTSNGKTVDITDLDHDAIGERLAVNLAIETLTGDMRDHILDRIRHEQDKRPWDERSEADQRETIARVEEHCQQLVTRAVELIAAAGRRTIKATLEQVTVKDAIVGKVVLSKHDAQRHALIDSTGARILIVVVDPEEFTGERAPAEVKPDQGDLIKSATVVHSGLDSTHPFN